MKNKEIRIEMIAKREKISFWQHLNLSKKLIKYHKRLIKYKNIGIYSSFRNEISLKFLCKKLLNCNIFTPVISKYPKQKMFMQKISSNKTLNRFKIIEPKFNKNNQIKYLKMDAILVPLVAFNERCERIGWGGGYYDRFLKNKVFQTKKPTLIGAAFDFQKSNKIQSKKHDIKMNQIMTENRIYKTS